MSTSNTGERSRPATGRPAKQGLYDPAFEHEACEFENGKFRKVMDRANWYFRVTEPTKVGPILMGQRMGSEGVFVGPIYQFVWKKNTFISGPKMSLPKDVWVFGLSLADLRKTGKPDVVFLDDRELLNIFDQKGKRCLG